MGIDGSKADLVHNKEEVAHKMGADVKINYVFDIYTEKLLGWDLAMSEDHSSHFRTWKMALETAGVKPMAITYDNQSGHKSEVMQKLYDNIIARGGTHYPHRAREHGSPVENLIGRFQKQYLNQMWNSDKQSPTSRMNDSKPNIDFIKKFKHKLPKKEEFKAVVAYCVDQWNNAQHPNLGCTRN